LPVNDTITNCVFAFISSSASYAHSESRDQCKKVLGEGQSRRKQSKNQTGQNVNENDSLGTKRDHKLIFGEQQKPPSAVSCTGAASSQPRERGWRQLHSQLSFSPPVRSLASAPGKYTLVSTLLKTADLYRSTKTLTHFSEFQTLAVNSSSAPEPELHLRVSW